MAEHDPADRARTKKRLLAQLRIAVGGLVIAAASLTAPAVAEASTVQDQKLSFEERAAQLKEQLGLKLNEDGDASAVLAAFHNWGNHWDKWSNWHNWPNWHNHH